MHDYVILTSMSPPPTTIIKIEWKAESLPLWEKACWVRSQETYFLTEAAVINRLSDCGQLPECLVLVLSCKREEWVAVLQATFQPSDSSSQP